MIHLTSRQLKIAGTVFLAIPMLILAAFAVGEMAGGDITGIQHIVQLAPLALLAWLAWKRPLWSGAVLIALALIFTGLYVIFIHGFPLPTVILTVAFLFATPLVAGMLFVAASRQERDGAPARDGDGLGGAAHDSGALLSRGSRCRDETELLHHAQPVIDVPLLHDPPTGNPAHDHPHRRHRPAGRREAS